MSAEGLLKGLKVERARWRESITALQHLFKRDALDKLHDEERHRPARHAVVSDVNDVRVLDAATATAS